MLVLKKVFDNFLSLPSLSFYNENTTIRWEILPLNTFNSKFKKYAEKNLLVIGFLCSNLTQCFLENLNNSIFANTRIDENTTCHKIDVR